MVTPAAKKYGGTSSGKIKMSKAASVSTEINLIGMTVDEAIAHLDIQIPFGVWQCVHGSL